MKTKHITLGVAAILLATSFTFTSCRKKETTKAQEPDTDQTAAKDNNLSESINNDIVAMGSQAAETQTLSTFKTINGSVGNTDVLSLAPSATVTVVGKLITVDFGTGIIGADGRTRSGKLMYDYSASPTGSDRYRKPGFTMSISTNSYVVDGNQVNIITKTVKNISPLSIATETAYSGTNLTWSITANVSIIKANSGGTVSWTCNRTKELTNCSDPLCYKGQFNAIDWTKAKIKINGSATGTSKDGEGFSATATNLLRDHTCSGTTGRRHFVSGQLAFTPSSKPTRTIDYGNGACDDLATLTVNGNTYNITLP